MGEVLAAPSDALLPVLSWGEKKQLLLCILHCGNVALRYTRDRNTVSGAPVHIYTTRPAPLGPTLTPEDPKRLRQ